jgi:hypothetical protein
MRASGSVWWCASSQRSSGAPSAVGASCTTNVLPARALERHHREARARGRDRGARSERTMWRQIQAGGGAAEVRIRPASTRTFGSTSIAG